MENIIEKQSLYSVDRFDKGFRLYRKDGMLDITLRLGEGDEAFICRMVPTGIEEPEEYLYSKIYVYQYRRILNYFVEVLSSNFEKKHKDKASKFRIKKWYASKLRKSLAYALFPEWQYLLTQIPEEDRNFLKLACSKLGPKFVATPALLRKAKESQFFWQDLHKYNAPWLTLTRITNNHFDARGDHSKERYYGHSESAPCASPLSPNDWRKVFAPEGITYKALNKTLDNWPRGVKYNLARHLRNIKLPVPITNRTHLLVLLLVLSDYRHGAEHVNTNVILNSSGDEVIKAFKKFKKVYETHIAHTKCPHINRRGASGLNTFVRYLLDYPHAHEGRILSLMERSIEWHREQENQRQADYAKRHPELKSEMTMPPLPTAEPLPEGLEYLDTVQKIWDEGERMKHCIASYATQALQRQVYLFHYESDGEAASIAVLPTGEIQQAYGPRNTPNNAAKDGRKTIQKWINKGWERGSNAVAVTYEVAF